MDKGIQNLLVFELCFQYRELASGFPPKRARDVLVSPWQVTPPLFGVGKTPNFMILTLSMLVKVEVRQSKKYNEMNDTEDVFVRQSGGEIRFR